MPVGVLAAAAVQVLLAADAVLGSTPLPVQQRKKVGGSKAGRTQTKQRKGFQARRRGAILFEYERRRLFELDSIPDLARGRQKKGAERHVATQIADGLVPDGERAPDSTWVLKILREIHSVGLDNYDPDADGRAAERPKMQKLTAADDTLLFATRKLQRRRRWCLCFF